MHKWEGTLFECNAKYEDIETCVQTWTCKNCNAEVRLPHGIDPDPMSGPDCKEKQKLFEAVQEFKKRAPVSWGNGKKARGGGNGRGN